MASLCLLKNVGFIKLQYAVTQGFLSSSLFASFIKQKILTAHVNENMSNIDTYFPLLCLYMTVSNNIIIFEVEAFKAL